MSDLKEYIITLKNYDDLLNFYEDMESPSGSLYIPNREVECVQRRINSRNTHYMLTDQESSVVKNDPRVLSVERKPEDIGIFPIRLLNAEIYPTFIQSSSNWDKSVSNNSQHLNWALLRCIEGIQRTNWGSNSTSSVSGNIQARIEGKNVDVVIVDGFINPDHPEFALGSDGTGGSRVIQYNWFTHSLGQSSNTYSYTPYVDIANTSRTDDNNHGAHCAGTAAGNLQGWARKSNIYNINPYGTDVNLVSSTLLIDYIRAFHVSKSINSETGKRNPTICNNSWGYNYILSASLITHIYFRGTTVTGPFTQQQLSNYGIYTAFINQELHAVCPARVASVDADVQDACNEGIIMVGAAGNDYTKIDVSGGQDYNNYFVWASALEIFYHRGTTPGASSGSICVGAISSNSDERKSNFSNTGPRVDIFAPGQNIISSFNSTGSFGGVSDSRNNNFYIGKISGTSMASPQVCGVLATTLEVYPNMTPAEAKEYIKYYATLNQITDTGGDVTDYTSLQGSANKYLFYYKERSDTGSLTPKYNVKIRPETGRVFPRVRIRR